MTSNYLCKQFMFQPIRPKQWQFHLASIAKVRLLFLIAENIYSDFYDFSILSSSLFFISVLHD